MIIAERKPIPEIQSFVAGYHKVLVVGCGTCVAVCLAGGSKEADILKNELSLSPTTAGSRFESRTLERQCDMEFLSELDGQAGEYDALLSMACGAGIQLLAERFSHIPVFPAVNTSCIGVNRSVGWYEENCRACGTCVLALTAGICPVTRCAKGLFNGPCGGTNITSCEIHPDQPCAWHLIYERLAAQDRLDQIMAISPANDWRNQQPRTIVQPGYEERTAALKEG